MAVKASSPLLVVMAATAAAAAAVVVGVCIVVGVVGVVVVVDVAAAAAAVVAGGIAARPEVEMEYARDMRTRQHPTWGRREVATAGSRPGAGTTRAP